MQKIDTRAPLWVVLTVLGAGIWGCGGSEPGEPNNSGLKVRYVALGAKIRGLDPGDIGDTTSSSVASQCYETLYQYHYLKRPYELIGCLAAEMPEVSQDGLTYTIKIRRDVYFADDECFKGGVGRQLRAEDFIYSWKRIANIKYLSKNWWVFDGRIVGLDEFREYTKTVENKEDVDYHRQVEGLQALDDFTLQIKLTKPSPQITYLLAHLPTAPMAAEAVKHYGDQIMNVMVGTGPFKLVSWKRGSKLVLARNEKFRPETYPCEGAPGDKEKGLLEDCGKSLPFFDGIEYMIVEENQPRWLLFMQGKIDASGIPKDFYSQAITEQRSLTPELASKGMKLFIQADPSTYWYGFNMEDPLVGGNLPLRRAMSCAWNRAEYIEIFTNNRGIPAKGFFPPMLKEHDPDFKNPWTEYSVARGKELMAEAVKVNGGKEIEVTLALPGTDTVFRQMGQYFQRCMDKIDLKVKIDYYDWPTFQDRIKSKSVQMFAMGWVADYPDGENFLQLFYGPNQSPGPNNFNYHNAAYDRLYEQIATMEDSPERLRLYRQMERMVCDDCVSILSLHGVGFVPYYKYLRNYNPHAFGYGLSKYVDIDVDVRRELVGR